MSIKPDFLRRCRSALQLCLEGLVSSSCHERPEEAQLEHYRSLSLQFIAQVLGAMFADDRGLLRLENEPDQVSSPRQLRQHVAAQLDSGIIFSRQSTRLAMIVGRLFRAIRHQHGGSADPDNPHLFGGGLSAVVISDFHLARLIDALSRAPEEHGAGQLSLIDFRYLGVPLLGTVYETLLCLQPKCASPPIGQPSQEGTAGGPAREPAITFEGASASRREAGSYYTPDAVARHIVERTLRPLSERCGQRRGGRAGGAAADSEITTLRLLDPAVGAGQFLIFASRMLAKSMTKDPGQNLPLLAENQRQVIANCLYGVDSDPLAIQLAKWSLWLEAGCPALPLTFLDHHLRCGDSLVGTRLKGIGGAAEFRHFDWQQSFPEVLAAGSAERGFDAVVGNPPYVNIRLLTRQRGELIKEYLRKTYSCARGAFDLYVLFLEQAIRLLRPGGRYGMIVPNKIGSLDYAAPCRELLLEKTSLELIADVSELEVFSGTGVYPYILVGSKSPPTATNRIAIHRPGNLRELGEARAETRLRQSTLTAAGGLTIHGEMDVESRVPTSPLRDLARLHSGTTGFSAQRMAAALCEQNERPCGREFVFVVSRNIDRYCIRPGDVRFAKRAFRSPVLDREHEILSERKRQLFAAPKLVIAGMTRRLEVAYDPGGLALGVQVFAAAGFSVDPRYLLGILNSKMMSCLFRIRFRAKHLAGGYLAINKGQLEKLPIRVVDPASADQRAAHDLIVENVERAMLAAKQAAAGTAADERAGAARELQRIDTRIDDAVHGLYRLSHREVQQVSQSYLG